MMTRERLKSIAIALSLSASMLSIIVNMWAIMRGKI